MWCNLPCKMQHQAWTRKLVQHDGNIPVCAPSSLLQRACVDKYDKQQKDTHSNIENQYKCALESKQRGEVLKRETNGHWGCWRAHGNNNSAARRFACAAWHGHVCCAHMGLGSGWSELGVKWAVWRWGCGYTNLFATARKMLSAQGYITGKVSVGVVLVVLNLVLDREIVVV